MSELHELGLKFLTDKAYHHNFLKIYEDYFKPLKDKEINLLEIGILNGGSLKTFWKYFEKGNIYGIDINPRKYVEQDRIKTFQGDATKKEVIASVFPEVEEFDIIIDDASHGMYDQQVTFEYFIKRLKSGGIYIIEDLHSSWDPLNLKDKSGKDISHKSTLEFLKALAGKSSNRDFFIDDFDSLQNHIEHLQVFLVKPLRPNDDGKESATSIIIKK